jgi:FKBP-type peptidyl-prolyl cis-trans isomerase SlyD
MDTRDSARERGPGGVAGRDPQVPIVARTLCHDDAMNVVEPPCVVTLTWQLCDGQGRPIDELAQPVEFLVGGNDLLEKIEQALAGQVAGFETELHLEPHDAFGDYRPELVCFEDRALFPKELESGMAFEGLPPGSRTPGMPSDVIYIATEVYPSHVVLDGNHPLAGIALRLKLRLRDVRPATPEEVEAGSVSGGLLAQLGATALPAPDTQH